VVELPEPEEPDDPDEPGLVAPLEAPLLGVLGEVVELLPELELPLAPVPPVAPELAPDLLKWASHSEREIWPSLLVSTDEKFGAMLEPAPLDDIPDEPLAPLLAPLEPDADGVLLEPDADGVLLLPEDELCAMATPDRARRAAAVALVTSFNIDHSSLRKG
jgi:hypothetical protein